MNAPEIKNPLVNAKIVGENVGQEVYCQQVVLRGDPKFVMSRGELVTFNQCPHRWLLGYESDETKATQWGTLIDALLFDGQSDERFVVAPETYPAPAHHKKVKNGEIEEGDPLPWNANATWCADWLAKHEDREIVKHEQWQQAQNAIKFLFGKPHVANFINDSRKQVMVTCEYHDDETGIIVPLKTLLDLVPESSSAFAKSLGDFKTANSAHPRAWQKAVFEHHYHTQAALYLDAYVAATGEDRIEFRHIIQESYPPWETDCAILSQDFIEAGRLFYVTALKFYCQCLKENNWPGYDSIPGQMTIQGWKLVPMEAWMVGR